MTKRKGNFYKKLHKWPGLIIAFLLLYYGVTGILMNHREFIASLDVNRNALPREYHYRNWNNSALKGSLTIRKDSILVFGNLGVYVTDSAFTRYRQLDKGLPKGTDNRKVFDLHHTPAGNLYAATQFGLYAYNAEHEKWQRFGLDVDLKRFVGIDHIGDTIYAINRSYLFKGTDKGVLTEFEKIELSAPANYVNEVSLFETIWQIHSGEIFGLPGKLFVDLLGVLTIFLSLTGIVYFFFPGWIKKRKRKKKNVSTLASTNRWSLKWHNKTGEWFFVFLIILFFTGMFLRPPLLIAIARAKVAPIKYSHLDQPNPWYDKLRDIRYDASRGLFFLSTSEGMFTFSTDSFTPKPTAVQPPVSVMGINVFKPYGESGGFLIGSFSGLFLWHPMHPQVIDFIRGNPYQPVAGGRPVGEFKITGLIEDTEGHLYMVDYDQGVLPLWHQGRFPAMPVKIIEDSRMSFWNLSLEIHTGRFFSFILRDFYILLVPLSGLTGIIVVLSGYLLWRKRFRRKKK